MVVLHHHSHNESPKIAIVGFLFCKLKRTVHKWAELLYWVLVESNILFSCLGGLGKENKQNFSMKRIKRRFWFPTEKKHSKAFRVGGEVIWKGEASQSK